MRWRPAAAVVVGLLLGVAAIQAVLATSPDEQPASPTPDSADRSASGSTHCEQPTEVDDGWECVHDQHFMYSRIPFDTSPTDIDRERAENFAESAQDYLARRFPDVESARAAGYVVDDRMEWLRYNEQRPEAQLLRDAMKGGIHTHLFNMANLTDDRLVDFTNPEALVYATDGTRYVLTGVLFLMPIGQHGPQFGGPLTIWHHHPGAGCWQGAVFVGFEVTPDGACVAGTTPEWTPEMLHVWFDRPTLDETYAMDVAPTWISSVLDDGR